MFQEEVIVSEIDKLAFASASDASKQVLTLTTAIVTITISFAKDITKGVPPSTQAWLSMAWLIYAISILAGTVSLLALTGSLARGLGSRSISVYDWNIRLPSIVQMISFAGGVLCTVAYGAFALTSV
ncbi:MAG: hypothetical protein M3Z25_16465 [Actinomycetota bacterium]|nr:hypothetical protein [Actinomycetota bacterium]